MLRIGVVEDDIGALIDVIRNLMALDKSRYEFQIVPVLLSDPSIDTPLAIRDKLADYGVKRLEGSVLTDWPMPVQRGLLCPVDEKQRAAILEYLANEKVDVIISDSWLGRGSKLVSKFGEKALTLAGMMLLDEAEKKECWAGKCWIMTTYEEDVFDRLRELLAVEGWVPQRFNVLARFLMKDKIIGTEPGTCYSPLESVVDECLTRASLTRPSAYSIGQDLGFGYFIGRSKAMQKLYEIIVTVAPHNAPVVIHGESGTGKELVARAIHDNSHRKNGPFVSVDCGAIPGELLESELFGHIKGSFTGASADKTGLFEEAEGGTILLDELGNLPLHMQDKLLRALQERQIRPLGAKSSQHISFDARVLAATNKKLALEVEQGRFKGDLLRRLSVIEITVPPLRDRKEDIGLLCKHFIGKYAQGGRVNDISADALSILTDFDWPWNVGQLENIIQRAIIFSGSADMIDKDNVAIKEIAEGGKSNGRSTGTSTQAESKMPSESNAVAYENMGASEIWDRIKKGAVVKTLPEWKEEIGRPKTLEIRRLVKSDPLFLAARGTTAKETLELRDALIARLFGMHYGAWRHWQWDSEGARTRTSDELDN